jgi:hypothetical protein
MRRLDPSRTARVRYEDFIEDPSTVLANVGRTVDVDLDGVAAALLAGMPMTARHTISGNRVRMAGAIRLKPDTEWKERLRPVTRRAMYMLTVPLMRRYGYRM